MIPTNQIIQGDCREVLKTFPKESVDCIITDPPFGIKKKEIIGDESLKTYETTLPFLYDVLKRNKWFITFVSVERIKEVLELTEQYFDYVWLGFIYYSNMERILHTPVGFSKISLFCIFKKGSPKKHYWLRDVLIYVYNRNENFYNHPSPKPLEPIIELVKFGSKLDEIVLDPFCGTGTTCLAAKEVGRKYIGIEIDSTYIKTSLHRLSLTTTSLKEW